jgi:hypothetical protein
MYDDRTNFETAMVQHLPIMTLLCTHVLLTPFREYTIICNKQSAMVCWTKKTIVQWPSVEISRIYLYDILLCD